MVSEIKKRINDTRNRLDKMLESETDKNKILEVSRELDELISEYIESV